LKKEAKTFATSAALLAAHRPDQSKFFGSFFQKRTASFLSSATSVHRSATAYAKFRLLWLHLAVPDLRPVTF
jgi:hypothetical protein